MDDSVNELNTVLVWPIPETTIMDVLCNFLVVALPCTRYMLYLVHTTTLRDTISPLVRSEGSPRTKNDL